MADTITPETIRTAMHTIAPGWATAKDRESVRKYKDWNEYYNENSFNRELFEV